MNRLFSVSFWVQLFMSTFLTMLMIYLIKKATSAVNIPIVSDIAQAV